MLKQKENIILADNGIEEIKEFKEEVEKTTNEQWNQYILKSNQPRKNKFSNIIRYMKYFYVGFKIFLHRKKYKNIIAWQQFYGLTYCFFCNLFKVKKVNKVTIMTFIYKEKSKKMYYKFIKYCINNDFVDNIICFSSLECEYYANLFKIDKNKFIFVPLGIRKIKSDEYIETKNTKEKYILAPGRSNRDYKFLIDSLKGTNYNVKIVSDELNEKTPENIQIYNNVFGKEFFLMFKECFCVVIPLDNEEISSGQLVALQAMQLRKPIIATKSKGLTDDYIENKISGLVINKNKEELLGALEQLYSSNELYENLVNNAYNNYENQYSIEALGRKIGRIVR